VGGDIDQKVAICYNEHVRGYLLDTFEKDRAGGTGKSFDWSLISMLGLEKPYILAGGLHSGNIIQAIESVQAYGVDINSGVEKLPGIKDHHKINEIIKLIRNWEE
jgi:phosphoribosylanthranilate isomerase